jgi:xylulokinase
LRAAKEQARTGSDPADTHRDLLVKAALEGVTYEMKWNLDLLEQAGISAQRIHAVGGGARSPVWLQLKADVFGREVVAIEGQASCIGAAACAAVGLGIYRSWQEAASGLIKSGTTYQPRAVLHRQYGER